MKLTISGYGSALAKRGECLLVRRRDCPDTEVPAAALSQILVAGRGISITTDVLALAMEQSIPVAFVSPAGEPYGLVLSPEATGGDAALRRTQLEAAATTIGFQLARRFVQTKLRNQRQLLLYFARTRATSQPAPAQAVREKADLVEIQCNRLADMEPAPIESSRSALMGCEGAAAQAYWQGIAALAPGPVEFHRRVHRDPQDGLNRALNYGYGILRSRIWSALVLRGLDPAAGFLHAWQPGRNSLVFDLMEGFRPTAVDRPVIGAILRGWRPQAEEENGFLDETSRRTAAELVLNQLDRGIRCGRKTRPLAAWIEHEINACIRILKGLRAPAMPVTHW